MITKRNLAIIRAYTGYPIGKFDWYDDYAQEVFGRPIRSSEYGQDKFYEELKEKSKEDYFKLDKKWTQLATIQELED